MNSCLVLKWHLKIFKICGLWPSENSSIYYKILIIFYNVTVNIGFPISKIICGLWINSVDAAVDYLLIASSITVAAIKAINVLSKRNKFIQLFDVMKKLDQSITCKEYVEIFQQKCQHSDNLFFITLVSYFMSWICLAIQVIMSKPADRMWSSTYPYPSEFLHHQTIYGAGIIFQAIANFFIVLVDVAVDTYGPSLLHILGGHIEVFGKRLKALGKNCTKYDDYKNEQKVLVDLCEKYILIIRLMKFERNFR